MSLQILINLLSIQYEWFRVKVHRYSHPAGLPSPLLISNNHGSLTCHFRNLIQARSGNKECNREFGGKRRRKVWVVRRLGKAPKSFPLLYIEKKHYCNDSLGFESRRRGSCRFKMNHHTNSNKPYQPNDGYLSSAYTDRPFDLTTSHTEQGQH